MWLVYHHGRMRSTLTCLVVLAAFAAACQRAPEATEATKEPGAWLSAQMDDQRVKLAARSGQPIREGWVRVQLGLPSGAPEGVSAVDYKEGQDRRLLRVYFSEDIGWEEACKRLDLVTPYLDSRDPIPMDVEGVQVPSTKILGLQRPFQYYAFYRVATTDVPNTAGRIMLDVELQ